MAWTWKQSQNCAERLAEGFASTNIHQETLLLCNGMHNIDTPPRDATSPHTSLWPTSVNATDSRNVFPSIQQLLESNINWNQWSMSSSSLCFSLPKDRWQNKSLLHRLSCFNFPVPMQDWWPYTRCLQGVCISSPGLLWQRAEESQKSSWNTPVSILSMARKEGFVFHLLALCF